MIDQIIIEEERGRGEWREWGEKNGKTERRKKKKNTGWTIN